MVSPGLAVQIIQAAEDATITQTEFEGIINSFTGAVVWIFGFWMFGMMIRSFVDEYGGSEHHSNPRQGTKTALAESINTSISQPSFKVRTIHYDDFNIKFGPHGEEIEKGILSRHPEYGTSMSLDGAYLDYPAFTPGISLFFPLEPSIDLPKFYLNPFGQYVMSGYMLDSPTFVRECEIKYPRDLDLKNCTGAVLHVNHQKIEEDLKRAKERWAKPSPETPVERQAEFARTLTERSEWYAKWAHETVSYIEQHFHVLSEVPATKFRRMTRDATPRVKSYRISPSYPTISKDLTEWQVWFNGLVEVSRPYHEAVAKAYSLSYRDICESAWKHIEGWLRK